MPGNPREFVAIRPLSGHGLPLLLTPTLPGVRIAEWLAAQAGYVDELLARHGAVLLRGFGCRSVGDLREIIDASGREMVEYVYRSTPRTRVGQSIHTSTEYPPSQTIPLHNEQSYSQDWPNRLWFACIQPASEGGATPLADCRRVTARLSTEIRTLFADGVLYVRNYGTGLDLSWQDVFQTDHRQAVEEFCTTSGIEFQWLPGDRLRTRQVCQAEVTHQVTGERVWFNQAHLFHVSALTEDVRSALTASIPEEDLPRNAYFPDGSAIPERMLTQIRDAYAEELVAIPWEAGDVMVIDNVLAAHGRQPYRGPRSVFVGMTK
ncbi:MAG: TauD/TfdA family dioxygenase [Pseudonocardiaceae bacterium]